MLEFTNVFNEVASDMFSRKKCHNIDSIKDNRIYMSWYSEECEDRRHDVLHLCNECCQNYLDENRKKEWYKPEHYLNHVPENADLTMIQIKPIHC